MATTMARAREAVCSWSGGKDAFLALGRALADPALRVTRLFTTATGAATTMHGVPVELVQAQARLLGLPLDLVPLPENASNEQWEAAVGGYLRARRAEGATAVVHGDVHLADVRAWRDERYAAWNLEGIYPLWHQDTAGLAKRFLDGGHRAYVVLVDTDRLDASFCGRRYDQAFLDDLPDGVDPLGEEWAFHTFVDDSPVFRAAVPCRITGVDPNGRFVRARLVPGDASGAPPRNPDLCGVPLFDPP